MIALVPVRDGEPANGGAEVVAECGGRAVLVGSGVDAGVAGLLGVATEVRLWEAGTFRPGTWAATLAPVLEDESIVVLPGSADGRDLAPRLAHAMGRPLLAGALAVHDAGAVARPLGWARHRGRRRPRGLRGHAAAGGAWRRAWAATGHL